MEIEGGDDEARGWLGRRGEERGAKGKEVLCIVRFVFCVMCDMYCVLCGMGAMYAISRYRHTVKRGQ